MVLDDTCVLYLPEKGLPSSRVALVGAPALVEAWTGIVGGRGLDPVAVDEAEREASFRAGCRAVLAHTVPPLARQGDESLEL